MQRGGSIAVVTVTGENFDELVLKSDRKVLLDFWASRCSSCRMVASVADEIATVDESVTVGKVNVDEEMELAARLGVTHIPALIVMEDGKTVAQALGYRPKPDILALLR